MRAVRGCWRWAGLLGPALILALIVWAAYDTAQQGCMLTCDYNRTEVRDNACLH